MALGFRAFTYAPQALSQPASLRPDYSRMGMFDHFNRLDTDRRNGIDPQELSRVAGGQLQSAFSPSQWGQLHQALDADRNGVLTVDEASRLGFLAETLGGGLPDGQFSPDELGGLKARLDTSLGLPPKFQQTGLQNLFHAVSSNQREFVKRWVPQQAEAYPYPPSEGLMTPDLKAAPPISADPRVGFGIAQQLQANQPVAANAWTELDKTVSSGKLLDKGFVNSLNDAQLTQWATTLANAGVQDNAGNMKQDVVAFIRDNLNPANPNRTPQTKKAAWNLVRALQHTWGVSPDLRTSSYDTNRTYGGEAQAVKQVLRQALATQGQSGNPGVLNQPDYQIR